MKRYLLLILVTFYPPLKISSQNYFQQEVNYKIRVTLDDQRHELNGFESIEYINNSPDTLKFLYFHLWPNAYSNNNTELAQGIFRNEGKKRLFNDPALRGYIDSLDFKDENDKLIWNLLPDSPDICKIFLNKPLIPGKSIQITTPFHVKIPEGVISRLGHIGESYQISQWYPKPAVYDRSGWHQMPYLDQGEFYSEYGSFDVSITLPANYIVGATGNLQNEKEKKFLDILSSDMSWLEDLQYEEDEFPLSSGQLKTLRYTEDNIHDFAWFADKRFHVLKGKVKLPDSGREVTTWAMFTNQEAHLWMEAISYINSAIRFFSECIGDYPYNSFKAVQSTLGSGAGMEYPGLTVIGLAGDPYFLDEVIAHEICHSWFYSALGSDERRFPFMDESLASAYETRYMEHRYPGKKLWEISFKNEKLARIFNIKDMPAERIQELEWLIPSRMNLEQPVNLAATDYSSDNYGNLIYYKAGQGFNYLRAYLGDPLFDSIMHDYYRTWKFRHPGPDDLRALFESSQEKDLSWFFDDFLGTTKRLDYKLARLDDHKLLIKNRGELESPLLLKVLVGDSISYEKWEDGFKGKRWINIGHNDFTGIKIDPGHKMTEMYRLNNNIKSTGLFRKADPFQLQFLYTVENSDKRTLLYIPLIDWNKSDGFMAGIALLNGTLIPRPVEYLIIPLYTFRKNEFVGYGKISFNITPYNNWIRLAVLSMEGEQFGAFEEGQYQKAKIGVDLWLRPARVIDPIWQKIFGYYIAASNITGVELMNQSQTRSFLQFGYQVEKRSVINPYNILATIESGKLFYKSAIDVNYKLSYYGRSNGLEIRLFGGAMLKNNSADPLYSFSASGRSGSELYLYDGIFPDRFGEFPKTFWSRQMSFSEGGLVTPITDSIGYSSWICSLTLSSSLPGKMALIPIKPFINVSLNDINSELADKPQLFFEAGLKAGIWNFLEIYIPLLVSENINTISGSVKDRIRFVFKLDIFDSIRFK